MTKLLLNPSIRCLNIQTLARSSSEMEQIGVDPAGIRLMTPKLVHLNLKISGLNPAQANIIKQEMLSVGGEAATSSGVVNCRAKMSDIIVSGTYKQIDQAIKKIRLQPFNLKNIAKAMEKTMSGLFSEDIILEGRKRRWAVNKRTLVMGILNVTPDSFFDGGKYSEKDLAVKRALEMVENGADIIDVGGESTRPGSKSVPLDVELKRVIPVVENLAQMGMAVSVDTRKAEVAKQALIKGAEIINDISSMTYDQRMSSVCADYGAAVILMHMRGTPEDMQINVSYNDLISDIFCYLKQRVEYAVESGIKLSGIAIDPGIGFGKSVKGNLRLLNRIAEFRTIGRPIVIGASRKSFIGKTLKLDTEERLEGSLAATAFAVLNGANIVRVHDVKETRRMVDMINAIENEGLPN